jgi:hypothetical protein
VLQTARICGKGFASCNVRAYAMHVMPAYDAWICRNISVSVTVACRTYRTNVRRESGDDRSAVNALLVESGSTIDHFGSDCKEFSLP